VDNYVLLLLEFISKNTALHQ